MKHSLQLIALTLLSIVAVSCSQELPLGENYGSSEVNSRQAVPAALSETTSDSEKSTPVIVTIVEETEVVADTVHCVIRR